MYTLFHSRQIMRSYRFSLNARKKIPYAIKFKASTARPEIHASRNIYFWAFTWSPANTDLTEILLPPERLCHIVLDLLCRSASKNAAKTARYDSHNLSVTPLLSMWLSMIFQDGCKNLHEISD